MEEKKCLIESSEAEARLDVFLRSKEPDVSRTALKELIQNGKVSVNGQKVKPHYKLKANDDVRWTVAEPEVSGLTPEDIPLNIIFEDDDLIVLDKPTGLVVHPGAGNKMHTLVHALLFHTKELSSISPERPGIVHRLDKETSGVMVVAKNNRSHLELAKQFKKHSIERRYVALVEGHVAFDEGAVDVPIKRHIMDRKKMSVSFTEEAKEAHTIYKVLKRYDAYTPLETGRQGRPSVTFDALSLTGYTAVELFPQTGRTHQLRVHLSYLGHPILGDATYGRKKNFSRLALHAKDLGFTHPSSGEFVKFSSPLPPEMKEAMSGVKID
jgi:23S rRNA pseudouridine1911/1915/1917 synthase